MANFIDTYNEKELLELEKEIDSIFREATKETQAKAEAYFERIEKLTKTKLQDLADGKITQAEYDSWLRGTIFQKDRFNAFISEYQAIINQYDSNALDLVSTKTPNVFANNANYVAYHLETGQKTDFNFQLWDKTTVDRLMKEDVTLLPQRKLSIPKNNAWNMKALKRQLTQGILQGESIQKIAKRMQTVTDMNKTNAVRNARTSMTTAQNAGRQARMEEAEGMGLIIKKVWVATLDGRTRQDHRELDGQTVGVSEQFHVDGDKLNYPGDIKAEPANLWNCRCTVIEKYEGITGSAEKRKLDTMKTDEYKAWKGAVEKGEVYEVPKVKVPDLGKSKEQNYYKETLDNEQLILRNAIAQEMEKQGAEVDSHGFVKLYHTTSKTRAQSIYENGFQGTSAPIAGGGAITEDIKDRSFFGYDRDWVTETWGNPEYDVIELKIPAEFLRQGTGIQKEVYVEGLIQQVSDDLWIPDTEATSTFFDRKLLKRYKRNEEK